MASTINVEWLNQNSQRNYPFRENMRLRPTIDGALSEEYRLPDGCLLDMVLATNFEVQPVAYMSAFTLAGNVATAVISDASDGTVLAVASAVQGDEEQTPVNFTGSGVHDDIRGTVVFGDLRKVGERIPDGVYRFSADESTFEARCVRPSVPCVSGLYVGVAGYEDAPRLRGDVALVAGNNVWLGFNEEYNAIVINADTNYGYNDKCACDQNERKEILTINGLSAGDVVIEGDECVSVTTENGRIRISDTCSKPCCGCAELTFLNQKTNEITTTIGKLESFAQLLLSKVTTLEVNRAVADISDISFNWR